MAKMGLLACFNWLLDLSLPLVSSPQDDHYSASQRCVPPATAAYFCLFALRVNLFKSTHCYNAPYIFNNMCIL